MKSNTTGLAHFTAAFRYSLAGLRHALGETAVRHELYLGIVHFIVLGILPVGWFAGLFLTALWVMILVVEILNTSIESVVDLVSPDFHPLAGRAKDLGSAAVFLMLTLFLIAWVVVLWQASMI